MDASAIVALAGVVVMVLSTVFGGVIRYLLGRIRELTQKVDLLTRTVDAKEEIIAVQNRQIDKYEITAEIQKRFFDQLPRQLPPSGDK